MLQNLSAVAANYRRAGIRRFVLACFVCCPGEVAGVREALGMPLRAVRLEAPLPGIGRRLAATSPAAAVTICVRRRHRSRRRRVLASRMWSSATTVPPGSQRAL